MKNIISNGMIISNENKDLDNSEYRWSNFVVNEDFTFINNDGKICYIDLAQITQEDSESECNYNLFVYEKDWEDGSINVQLEDVFKDETVINEIKIAMLELSKNQYSY